MGQGKAGVKASPEEIEREVKSIREGMDPIVTELDHRRHQVAELPQRMKRLGSSPLVRMGAIVIGLFGTMIAVRNIMQEKKRRSMQRQI